MKERYIVETFAILTGTLHGITNAITNENSIILDYDLSINMTNIAIIMFSNYIHISSGRTFQNLENKRNLIIIKSTVSTGLYFLAKSFTYNLLN